MDCRASLAATGKGDCSGGSVVEIHVRHVLHFFCGIQHLSRLRHNQAMTAFDSFVATTMNQFFVVAIAEKISAMETADFFSKRAALATLGATPIAWDKVGIQSALPADSWVSQASSK